MTSSPDSNNDHWLRRSGYFREVVGYPEAVDLRLDPRAHARFAIVAVDGFEGGGLAGASLTISFSAREPC